MTTDNDLRSEEVIERPGILNALDYATAQLAAASPEPAEDTIERMAEAREVVRRFMLYLDEWGYESHGALAREFGPVEFEGSSQSTEAWLDRVLRAPARAVLAAEHGGQA